ncbi:MAG: DUF4878 domain-containing protein [Pyrinomonadaceae bacterium]|nr:DUF4878 domain-containing protein [Pyrinomonadaceae bacterium]
MKNARHGSLSVINRQPRFSFLLALDWCTLSQLFSFNHHGRAPIHAPNRNLAQHPPLSNLEHLKENSLMNTRRMLALVLALALTTLATAACNRAGSSPTATYKAAYAAMKNKDVAGFKKVMTKESQKDIEELAKKMNKSSDDMLKDMMNEFKLPPSDESKDEKIDGDNATLQVKDEKGAWETIRFLKEDGEWKMK